MAIKQEKTVFLDRIVPEIKKKADRTPLKDKIRKRSAHLRSNLKRSNVAILVLLFVMAIVPGCNQNSRGFVLPEGDIKEGKLTFVELNCNQCHSVGEIKWAGEANDVEVKLGGGVTGLKTYGQLVTSVINPSHTIASRYLKEKVVEGGVSKMKIYNDVMTVEQLVDLVTFLQTEYEITYPADPYHYQSY